MWLICLANQHTQSFKASHYIPSGYGLKLPTWSDTPYDIATVVNEYNMANDNLLYFWSHNPYSKRKQVIKWLYKNSRCA